MDSTLAEILEAWRGLRDDPAQFIDPEQIWRWAASSDLEALGALSSLLFDPDASRRIRPGLSLSDYLRIQLPYLERCLKEDPQGRFADARWEAGSLIANWMKLVWAKDQTRHSVDAFRDWLGHLYKSAPENPDLRLCLVQATLEHAFEVPGIAERFAEWRSDPTLRDAYDEAKQWKDGLDALQIDDRSDDEE